jgi:hypothetical protein
MATIRTHTTLRTLFVATAVFAVLAAMWTAEPRVGPVHVIVTPCAVCFVAAILGLSLGSALSMSVVTTLFISVYRVATERSQPVALDGAIREGVRYALHFACWFGALWLTSWWWGSYLRYVWSKPRIPGEAIAQDEDLQSRAQRLSLYERMLARCELTPVGIFIITVLANVMIFALMSTALPLQVVRE